MCVLKTLYINFCFIFKLPTYLKSNNDNKTTKISSHFVIKCYLPSTLIYIYNCYTNIWSL